MESNKLNAPLLNNDGTKFINNNYAYLYNKEDLKDNDENLLNILFNSILFWPEIFSSTFGLIFQGI